MENLSGYLAEEFALETGESFFITGKAGTGKTTLLKKILTQTTKKHLVVAPTGIAAINASGVTIHSQFGLPLKAFIPTEEHIDPNIASNIPQLKSHFRYNSEKRKILQKLELLIIDEISMVRADILDAVDIALKFVRRNNQPFGGVQLIVFGDLFQLSPVVRDHEWETLKDFYPSPLFFHSLAWKAKKAFTIELQKVYRQKDQEFIEILNRVRKNTSSSSDITYLNGQHSESIKDLKGTILLTTHNSKANKINKEELEKISSKSTFISAEVEGEFNESAYPVLETLELKEGAQVMFTRNDVENKKYYNGKLATIHSIEKNKIWVKLLDDNKKLELKKETWENKKYTLNSESGEIEQKSLGKFIQYPIRLAWAITIHKSQGLTFEKAIIDPEKSFASGQLYVALSRCTSLEGITLKSKIRPYQIKSDPNIQQFYQQKNDLSYLNDFLAESKEKYQIIHLQKQFSLLEITERIGEWKEGISDGNLLEHLKWVRVSTQAFGKIKELRETQLKFDGQLHHLFSELEEEKNYQEIILRTEKAIDYFTEQLFLEVITPIHLHVKDFSLKKGTKKQLRLTINILNLLWRKLETLYSLEFDSENIYKKGKQRTKSELPEIAETTNKPTEQITLDLFLEGFSIKEIAEKRSLLNSTIETHLTKWVAKGKLSIERVIPKNRYEKILPYFEKAEKISLNSLKQTIPFEVTFSELKFVLADFRKNERT